MDQTTRTEVSVAILGVHIEDEDAKMDDPEIETEVANKLRIAAKLKGASASGLKGVASDKLKQKGI